MSIFSLAAALALVGAAQAQFSEVEPNDTKATATAITLAPGESVTGVTTGFAGAGDGSIDYVRVTTAGAPLGIYRHRLALTATDPTLYNFSLRGSPQSNGVPATGDALVQLAGGTQDLTSYMQWYGFGRGEFVFARLTGTAQTLGSYTLTASREVVTPTIIAAPVAAGPVTITTRGRTSVDTEFWVYDSNLFALGTFGNDDETIAGGGSNATRQSIATRTLSDGVYYIAISDHNLANNLGSPSDDRFRIAAVLDSPGSIAGGDIDVADDLDFAIISNAGTVETLARKPGPFGVAWFAFTVGPQDVPVALAAPVSVVEGQSAVLRAAVTPVASPASTQITVSADASSLGAGTITLRDDGVAPDTVANDRVFAASFVAGVAATANPVAVPLQVADAQGRSSVGLATVAVTASASGACCVNGACQLSREFLCSQASGAFLGAGSSCGDLTVVTGASALEQLTSATQLTLASITDGNLDDGRWTVALPFGFSFFGETFTSMSVCTNGFVQFGPASGYSTEYLPAAIPTAAAPNAMIAALWSDLEVPATGAIETQTLGAIGSRRQIVQWRNVRRLSTPSDSFTMQIVLFEGSNRIEVRYGVLSGVPSDAVAGVENLAGTSGISIAAIGSDTAFAPLASCAAGCDGIDFNNNQVFPEDQDVIDFFTVLAGGACATCNDIDFNNNQVFPEDQDVIDFFTVLAGGT
ncbi:MAG TPA: choice-of-anchor X domain-containing protein, partial [Phycisphaerales bacterium]|nr:choice-of-anchor X domain-containing protein [Phycisphaerales bacterium]